MTFVIIIHIKTPRKGVKRGQKGSVYCHLLRASEYLSQVPQSAHRAPDLVVSLNPANFLSLANLGNKSFSAIKNLGPGWYLKTSEENK